VFAAENLLFTTLFGDVSINKKRKPKREIVSVFCLIF